LTRRSHSGPVWPGIRARAVGLG